MSVLLLAIALAQHRPCEAQAPSPEPPLAVGVAVPCVQDVRNGFVPYHLIPVERHRFPVAEAIVERARAIRRR